MRKNKISTIFLLFILITSITRPTYCDIELEDIDSSYLEETIQTTSNTTDAPAINSRAAIVFDRNSKTIIYGKNENEQRKMASTTKIMTATIVLENCNLKDTVEVSKKAASIQGSRLGLTTKCKITVNDLLYGLMLCSGNDAAVT